MNDFENRMNRAAEEVRQSTKSLTPPPGKHLQPAPARRGWLVFAGAFAVVAIAVGVLPLFDRDPGVPVGSPDTTTPVVPPSTTVGTPVPTTMPVECSASGVPVPPEPVGLPDQVNDVRLGIVEAASACDLATLEAMAADNFTTHFGGGGVEELRNWEEAGEGKLGILLQILGMSYAVQETGDGDTYYVWPAAFASDSWDDISDEHMDELRAIYTQEELDQLSSFGVYAGWRTGINADGEWRYFVAGD